MNYEAVFTNSLLALRAKQDNLANIILNANFIRTPQGVLDAGAIALEYVRLVADLQSTAQAIATLQNTIAQAQTQNKPIPPAAPPQPANDPVAPDGGTDAGN